MSSVFPPSEFEVKIWFSPVCDDSRASKTSHVCAGFKGFLKHSTKCKGSIFYLFDVLVLSDFSKMSSNLLPPPSYEEAMSSPIESLVSNIVTPQPIFIIENEFQELPRRQHQQASHTRHHSRRDNVFHFEENVSRTITSQVEDEPKCCLYYVLLKWFLFIMWMLYIFLQ